MLGKKDNYYYSKFVLKKHIETMGHLLSLMLTWTADAIRALMLQLPSDAAHSLLSFSQHFFLSFSRIFVILSCFINRYNLIHFIMLV